MASATSKSYSLDGKLINTPVNVENSGMQDCGDIAVIAQILSIFHGYEPAHLAGLSYRGMQ